jgi:hypothetical protein
MIRARRIVVTALAAEGLALAAWGCSGSSGSVSAKPPRGDDSPYQFDDPQCKLEPNGGGSDYDTSTAEHALRLAAARARSCQASGPTESWTVDLTWAPEGCVKFVHVGESWPPASARCLVDSYRRAALPPFKGSAAHAVLTSPGVTLDLFRVGSLPPATIQSVVRGQYASFQTCYQHGLRRNPALRGRVQARFTIRESGAVSEVGNAGSNVSDTELVNCILQLFLTLRFPPPEGGRVTVVYPIMLEPG